MSHLSVACGEQLSSEVSSLCSRHTGVAALGDYFRLVSEIQLSPHPPL